MAPPAGASVTLVLEEINTLNFMKLKIRFGVTFFLMLCFLCSCENKEEVLFKENLLNKKWVYNPYDKIKDNTVFIIYTKFHDNNTYQNYYIGSDNEAVDYHHSYELQEWEFDSENKIFEVFGFSFDVLSVKNDKISLRKRDDMKIVTLYNVTCKHYDEDGLEINNDMYK